jgi:hypothetical protein
MEVLVAQEIDQLISQTEPELAMGLNRSDAIAYSLNRLPALYATTEEGWKWQLERAKSSLKGLIEMAARWGVEEAHRQSKHFSTPLEGNLAHQAENSHASTAAETALTELKVLLDREDLTWENLTQTVEQALQTSTTTEELHHSHNLLHAVRNNLVGGSLGSSTAGHLENLRRREFLAG